MEKYVEVFTASDITFAYLMKARLEDAGIPVQIANENLQGMYCLDGMVPRVLVPQKYAEQAREIIKEIQDVRNSKLDDDYDDSDEDEDSLDEDYDTDSLKEDEEDFEEQDLEDEEDIYD